MAHQPNAPFLSDAHSDKTQSVGGNCVIPPQSQRNRWRHRVRHCRKLSFGLTDSGIDLGIDVAVEHRQANPDNDMRVGKVVPTLMMGHGHPPVQALAEPTHWVLTLFNTRLWYPC